MSLQKKISLFAVLGLLLIFGLLGFLGVRALQESTERTLAERLVIARMVAQSMDQTLSQALDQLDSFASQRWMELGDLELGKKALRELSLYSSAFSGNLFLLDTRGKAIWTEPYDPALVGSSLLSNTAVQKTLQAGKPHIASLVSSSGQKPLVSLFVPIRDGQGAVAGLVGGNIDVTSSAISGSIENIRLGKTAYAEIINEDGIAMVTTKPGRTVDAFEKGDHADRFATLIQEGKATVSTCHRCHETAKGAEMRKDILAFAPLSTVSWGVAIRQSEEEALALTRNLEKAMLWSGGGVLIATLALTWIGTRSIVRPVEELTAASRRIAGGDFDTVITPRGGGEIDTLARTFEAMRIKLKASHQSIEEKARDIERRNRELSLLCDISRAITSTLELDSLLTTIVGKMVEAIEPTEGGVLLLYEPGPGHLLVRASAGSPFLSQNEWASGEGIPGRVFLTAKPLLHTEEGGITLLCVPLISKEQAIGCVLLRGSSKSRDFSKSDLQLLQAMSDEVAIAIENLQLYEELQRKEQIRGRLLERVISTQEEERKRIARELHDEAGQALTALVMSLGAAEQTLPPEAKQVKASLAAVRSLAAQTMEDIDRLIADLRPTLLDDMGLVPALRWYTKKYSERLGIDVSLQISGLKKTRLPGPVETALFRIVQEALTNVAKHADTSTVSVRLELRNSTISATVEDSGKGFSMDTVLRSKDERQALGLVGMEERASFLGGVLHIESQPGEGTKVFVEVPLNG